MIKKSGVLNLVTMGALCLSPVGVIADEDARESYDDGGYNYVGGLSIGYKYQEMEADTIRNAYVETIGLNIIALEWFPEQASWMQKASWLAAIRPQLSYEFTPGDSADQDEIAKASASEKEGWTRFVADLEVDVARLIKGSDKPSGHHLTLDYDVQTFLVTVQATQDYYYKDDGTARLLTAGDKLDVNTTFTDQTLGYEFDTGVFSMGMGYFKVDYEKPISSDVSSAIETIYKGTFEADGLFLSLGGSFFGADVFFRYDNTIDATVEVDNGTSITQTSFGFDESIEYDAYTLEVEYDFMDSPYKLPIRVGLNYVQREFSNFTEGDRLNDDKIFGLSVIGSFTL